MYDKVKHIKLDAKTFISSGCQCSFPHVFEMYKSDKYPESKPEYSITLLIDPKDPFYKALEARIDQMMVSEYGKNKERWPERWNNPIKNGSSKADKYPEMDGMKTIKANSKRDKPLAIDVNKKEIIDPREIYGGAYVRVKFDLYQMNKKKGYHGVGLGLRLVQKLADAEPFGEGSAPEKVEELPDLDASVVSNAGSFDDWDK